MNSKNKWNEKYRDRINQFKESLPNTRLTNLSAYLKGGSAVDLACGLGSNSQYLAKLNYEVHAYDISDVAINYLKEQVVGHNLSIHPTVCDLTEWNKLNLQKNDFDLVIITNYLDRLIFPFVKSIIKEKGYFFMETFYLSPYKQTLDISNQFKLQPQELLNEFGDWKVLYYEENEPEGRQTIFCQKLS